jgi:hypothetical protein
MKYMSLARRLFIYCAIGAGVCAGSQVGLLFCFFTHELVGKYIYLPFLWLSSWPNMLFQPLFPQTLPNWLNGLGWPINCFISLIGWLELAALVALSVHGVGLLRPGPTNQMQRTRR